MFEENSTYTTDDGYFLEYSLVSKAFRVFNKRRQQETYHITFDESHDAIKFSKPSVDNINSAETRRYLPDEYLHPYEPSQSNEFPNHVCKLDSNKLQEHGFNLKGYSDSDYVECNIDKKSTSVNVGCCTNILWMKSQLTDYDIIYEKVTKDEGNDVVAVSWCDGFDDDYLCFLIIMVNVIPPDHVDDVPVVEPNQHDDVPIVPDLVLQDEDEDPKEEEFKEEEEP
ncbi:hypothetical protein Tco_0732437 [Tanacetum coccineum]